MEERNEDKMMRDVEILTVIANLGSSISFHKNLYRHMADAQRAAVEECDRLRKECNDLKVSNGIVADELAREKAYSDSLECSLRNGCYICTRKTKKSKANRSSDGRFRGKA